MINKECFYNKDLKLYYVAMQNLSLESIITLSYYAEQFEKVKFSHISNKEDSKFTYIWFSEINVPYMSLVEKLTNIYVALEKKGGDDMVINKDKAIVPITTVKENVEINSDGPDKIKKTRSHKKFIKTTIKETIKPSPALFDDKVTTYIPVNKRKQRDYYSSYLDSRNKTNIADLLLGFGSLFVFFGCLFLSYILGNR